MDGWFTHLGLMDGWFTPRSSPEEMTVDWSTHKMIRKSTDDDTDEILAIWLGLSNAETGERAPFVGERQVSKLSRRTACW
jgi:hypothetical protein